MTLTSGFVYLLIAILFEVIGTTALKLSEGYTKLWPSVTMVGCYVVSFYIFSLALKTMPVGVAYSIWAGLGLVLVAIVGVVYFKQSLDLAGILGIGLILAGILVLRLFSNVGIEG